MSIKLIAADLDGTLLNSERRLSPDLFPLIRALRERGIRFAPASGRQYYNLREMFAPIASELLFISENGAMVGSGEEILSFEAMEQAQVVRAVEAVRELPETYAILSCREGAFYEQREDTVFLENISYYFARRRYTDDLLALARSEPVCKVAVFSSRRAERVILPAMAGFAPDSHVVLSSADWVDLIRADMNKGFAIGTICGKLDIRPEECMAFGDYLNDLEMLQSVGESYAMANAHPDLKAAARHVCPSNDEDGVCRTIRAALGLDKA